MFLVLLDLGHGPVLPFQALLLPLCYLLQAMRCGIAAVIEKRSQEQTHVYGNLL